MISFGTYIRGIVVSATCLSIVVEASAFQNSIGKPTSAPEPQPTDVQAVHYSGQTFITWAESAAVSGESYRIYRSSKIIENVNDPGVQDLRKQTFEDSGEFYSDRVFEDQPCGSGVLNCGRPTKPMPCFRGRYVDRMWIPDGIGGAREVPDGEGLLVWTLECQDFPGAACNGWAWYAVTAVDPSGNENPVVTAENRVRVFEGFAEPLPIEVPTQYMDCSIPGYCPHDNASDPNPILPGLHVFIQYMNLRDWNDTFTAPNFTNCWWGEDPGEVHIQNNRQYAFSYVVAEPDPSLPSAPGEPTPVVLDLHHHSNNAVGPRWGIKGVDAYATGGGAIKIMPTDVGDTWWFGFNSQFDYTAFSTGHCFDAGCSYARAPFPPTAPFSQMPTRGEIVNYTEARVLRMVYDLMRMPLSGYPADPDRIYIQGQSMGATGGMQLSTRYPTIFAAAACAKPLTDFEQYLVGSPAPKPTHDSRHEVPVRWGPYPSLASSQGLQLLGIRTTGPGEWANHLAEWDGTVIWDWMDLIEQVKSPERMGDDSAPMGIVSGFGDMVVPYPTQGMPFYDQSGGWGDLGRAWGGKITCKGHNGPIHEGMPPALTASATNPTPAPFSDYNIRRMESIPGFMNLSGGHYPTPPVTCCKAPCVPQGPHYYYQDLIWSSSWYDWDAAPFELPGRWAMSVKWTGGFNPAPTVDIVPRRLQTFKVLPGVPYQWVNIELGTGVTVQAASAPIKPTPTGLLVLEDVRLTPPGNRIILFRQP